MSNFTFDPETHEYREDGVLIRSVTQILQGVGIISYLGIDPAVLDHKKQIGKAVHLACEYYDKGILESVPGLYAGYVEAYKRFRDEVPCDWSMIEQPMVANVDTMPYGMTLDRAGLIRGKISVGELKATAQEERSWPIQLAAYVLGISKEVLPRYAIWLKPDGKYRLIEYKDKRDFQIFRQALSIEYWKKQKEK